MNPKNPSGWAVSAHEKPRLLAALRASPWASVAVKVIGAAGALLLLAWIGRSAPRWAVPNAAAQVAVSDAGSPAGSASGALTATPSASVSAAALPVASLPSVVSAPAVVHSRASPDDPVYLNRAGVDELRRLPGVGLKRAEAIVALRSRMGRFQRVEDLLKVKGIGRASIRKWRPVLRLDTPVTVDGGGAL